MSGDSQSLNRNIPESTSTSPAIEELPQAMLHQHSQDQASNGQQNPQFPNTPAPVQDASLDDQFLELQIAVTDPLQSASSEDQPSLQQFCDTNTNTTASPPTGQSCTDPKNFGLGNSEENLSQILTLTPIPTIILNSDLKIIHISESHLKFSGLPKEEYFGKHILEVEPSKIPIPDAETTSKFIDMAITSGDSQLMSEVEGHSSDSSYSLRATPIFKANEFLYLIMEALDTSDLHLKSKVQESVYAMETYRVLVDTVSEYAIFMLDVNGRVTTWNSGAAILKGYSTEEIVGRHFSIFYAAADRITGKPSKELALALQNGKVEDEGWRCRKDGSRFWANVTLTPVYQLGQHIGFVKVTRDLTERKNAEARLISAYEETSKLKNDFLAHMSHEIKTPLNGILGALTLLLTTSLNPHQRECVSIMEQSSAVLLQLINDILDYSMLTSGAFALEADVFNVDDVVTSVVRGCESTFQEEKTLEVRTTIDPDFPTNVRGDPVRFRQVMQNLIGNAFKFTDEGYVHVNTMCVRDPQDGNYDVTVEVIDSGIGIAPDAMGTLFSPFNRPAETTKRYQGTGLGLSICKSLAELMGGAVRYRTNPDTRGSIFSLNLKLGQIDMPTPRFPISPTLDPCEEIKKIAPYKPLLLVEDNKLNQVVLLKMLQTLGFERVDACWDGAQAVSLIKQKPLAYHAILMDVNMPVMDGVEATAAIRAMGNDIPIIAVTGHALKGDAESFLANGMSDFIAKPIHRKDIALILLQWIGPAPTPPPLPAP